MSNSYFSNYYSYNLVGLTAIICILKNHKLFVYEKKFDIYFIALITIKKSNQDYVALIS